MDFMMEQLEKIPALSVRVWDLPTLAQLDQWWTSENARNGMALVGIGSLVVIPADSAAAGRDLPEDGGGSGGGEGGSGSKGRSGRGAPKTFGELVASRTGAAGVGEVDAKVIARNRNFWLVRVDGAPPAHLRNGDTTSTCGCTPATALPASLRTWGGGKQRRSEQRNTVKARKCKVFNMKQSGLDPVQC
jgi:hypothetical protein